MSSAKRVEALAARAAEVNRGGARAAHPGPGRRTRAGTRPRLACRPHGRRRRSVRARAAARGRPAARSCRSGGRGSGRRRGPSPRPRAAGGTRKAWRRCRARFPARRTPKVGATLWTRPRQTQPAAQTARRQAEGATTDPSTPRKVCQGLRARCCAARPGGEEGGAEEQLGPGEVGQLFLHGCSDHFPRTARHPLVDGGEGPHTATPSCASRRGALSGTLRSSTAQRPPPERTAAPWAMTSPHSGTCVKAYVDRIASTSAGNSNSAASACTRLTLRQPFALYPPLGLGEHRVGQVDAHDLAVGTDRLLEQREVQTGAAGDVDHAVTRA